MPLPLGLPASKSHAQRLGSTHRVLLQCLDAPMRDQGGHVSVPVAVLNEAEEEVRRLLL